MPYTPIVGTLGYILSPDGKRVLLVHRNARAHDDHLGKYNGLGGKMEPQEDVASCMKREILEESGIHATKMRLRGTINWTGFGPKLQDWMGFIFAIDAFEGEPWKDSPEGPLEWVAIDQLDKLPMWEGDRHFLPMIFDDNPSPFHGYMAYENDRCLAWRYER